MKLPEQDDLGGNRRRVLARVQIEEAEVDLDVAVSRVQAAQCQDAFASLRQARMVVIAGPRP